MSAKDVGTWITIGMLAVGAVTRFVSLEEAKAIGVQNDVRQDAAADQLERRLRAVEQSRELERQIAALTAEVAALRAEFRASTARRRQ